MTMLFIHKLLITVEERIQMNVMKIGLYIKSIQKKIIDKKIQKSSKKTMMWKIATMATLERQHCSRNTSNVALIFVGDSVVERSNEEQESWK